MNELKMGPEDILKHNSEINRRISVLMKEVEVLRGQIIAPCESCHQEGEFRCNACSEAGFAGYNVRDYP